MSSAVILWIEIQIVGDPAEVIEHILFPVAKEVLEVFVYSFVFLRWGVAVA